MKVSVKKEKAPVIPNFTPHLIVSGDDGAQTGYLQLHPEAGKIEIGPADHKEFKLIKCLFSPENFLFARYSSAFQTVERVYSAMEVAPGISNIPLQNLLAPVQEMRALIMSAIKTIHRREVGAHVRFEWIEDRVRMEVIAPL